MPRFGSLGKFFGKTVSESAAFAAGVAIAPTLEPVVEELRQQAWAKGHNKRLDPEIAAAIVAEGAATTAWGHSEAAAHGYSGAKFDQLLEEALNAPDLGSLYELLRRNRITPAEFQHGLRKAKLETRWDADLLALEDVLLSSEELAMMQQQGFIPASRANSEGRLQGVTPERQQLRYEASGLPPGPETALDMLRRGIINASEFTQIVREGHTKTKYTDEYLALRNHVLGHNDYVTARVRGWITDAEMYKGGALTGYSQDDMDTLFKNHGRPLSWHQIHIGLARGGTYGGGTGGIAQPFLKGLQESDIRPEWYNLAWAQRYTMPSAFVLRGLVADGTFTPAQAETILVDSGWVPAYAKQAAAHWGSTKSGAAKEATASDVLTLYESGHRTHAETITALVGLGYPADEAQTKLDVQAAKRVVSEEGRVITALHKHYTKGEINEAEARTALGDLGTADWAIGRIITTWNVEKHYAP